MAEIYAPIKAMPVQTPAEESFGIIGDHQKLWNERLSSMQAELDQHDNRTRELLDGIEVAKRVLNGLGDATAPLPVRLLDTDTNSVSGVARRAC